MNIKETLEQLLEARKTRMIEIFEENLLADRVKVQRIFNQSVEAMTGMIQEDTESVFYKFNVNFKTNVACGDLAEPTIEKINESIENAALKFYAITALMHNFDVKFDNIQFGNDWESRRWAKIRFYALLENTTSWENLERQVSTDEQIHETAVKLTEEALASFVSKMIKKLAAIGNVSDAEIDSQWKNLDQTSLNLTFDNGIRFNLVNSIVYKTSSKGNAFMQFPARFSNVTMNGEFQKGCASEAAVKRLSKSL